MITTRPPLGEDLHKKTIDTSGSEAENRLFAQLHSFFKRCSRSKVEVSETVRKLLKQRKKEKWACAEFEVYAGASLKNAPPQNLGYPTLGYLLSVPAIWKGGPRLLALFGLGGTETLVWAYLLSTKYRTFLERVLSSRKKELLTGQFHVSLSRYSVPSDMTFADKYIVDSVDCIIS